MDASEIELYGENFCNFFGINFIKKYCRINLSTESFHQELLKFIGSHSSTDNEINFMKPSFWRNIIDFLDLKFTVNRHCFKQEFKWEMLVRCFFLVVYPNC